MNIKYYESILLRRIFNIKDSYILAFIVVAGGLLRLAAILSFEHSPESDELAYQSMATNFLAGNGIVDHMGNRAFYNVGYSLFVLVPVFAVFGDNLMAARLANLLLGAISIFMSHEVARQAGAGRAGRHIAASIYAFYLPACVYCIYLAKENLLTVLLLGVIYFILRSLDKPSIPSAIYCGILFGLIALTGNSLLSLFLVALVTLLISKITWTKRILYTSIIFFSTITIIAPWIIRNDRVVGAPVLNTNGGFNLYIGNNPSATGMFVSIADTPRGQTWRDLREAGELFASETVKSDAVEWIRSHPIEAFKLSLIKAAYFWTPPLHGGKGPMSKMEVLVRSLWAVQFILILVFSVGTLIIGRMLNKKLFILWLSISAYWAVHMIFM